MVDILSLGMIVSVYLSFIENFFAPTQSFFGASSLIWRDLKTERDELGILNPETKDSIKLTTINKYNIVNFS